METAARTWTLAHKWRSASDLACLALCADELAKSGIRYAHATDPVAADALKMHAQALVDAAREGRPALADLARAARMARWPERLVPAAWRFMQHGGRVHGIPVGLHRSNGAWANREIARRVDERLGGGPVSFVQWLDEAARHVAKPLLLAGSPWQAAVLFEGVCLAVAGEATYRAAFERLDPEALGGPAMIESLQQFARLRAYVDAGRSALAWDGQFDGMRRGEGAVMVMGDWVTARLPAEIVSLQLADVTAHDALVVDYFVPVADRDGAVSDEVAVRLTADDFQARFSRTKGCATVLRAGAEAEARARPSVPSLAFEQCCGVEPTRRLLDVLSDHFHQQRPAAATARALVGAACG